MEEYIKREDALNALLDKMVGTGYQSRAMDAIKFIPPADVISKEFLTRKEDEAYARGYAEAKSEVVGEIFEEINEALTNLEYSIQSPRKTIKIEELKAQVDWILHGVVPKTLAGLKKKYEEPEV